MPFWHRVPKNEIFTNTRDGYQHHHEQEPMKKINTPLIDHTFEGVVKQQWYRDYVEVDDLLLSEMLAAADFMDIGEYSLFVAWG